MPQISLTIDGIEIEADEGTMVLDVARKAGIEIPTVCAHEDLAPYGACRLCIVDIEGMPGLPTSCTTPAAPGMVVHTQTEALQSLRQRTLELMLSGHPKGCLVCPHRTDCENHRPNPTKAGRTTRCGFCSNRSGCSIRDMSFEMCPTSELDLPTIYYGYNLERSDPFMDRDYNLCVLCAKCWRICEKIHGKPALSLVNRGRWARPGTNFDKSYVGSGCTFCGACIDICPTGTLSDRTGRWHGQPDKITLSTCTLCPEGCSMWVHTTDGKVTSTRMWAFDRESRLCALGRFVFAQMHNAPIRLRRPYVRTNGESIPMEWDDALKAAAERLSAFDKGQVVVIASECDTRETRYLYQKLAVEELSADVLFVPLGGSGDPSLGERLRDGSVKAAIVAGDFLDQESIERLECLIAVDWRPSDVSRNADIVLPAAILSESEGTFRDASGNVRSVPCCSETVGEARPEWRIVRDIARAMGSEEFDYETINDVTSEIVDDRPPSPWNGSPRDNLKELPGHFRGHCIADSAQEVEMLGLPTKAVRKRSETEEEGFRIIEKKEIVPNFHLLEVEAPQVARFAKPGQFVIVMVSEESERVPYTLADWNEETGTITMIVEEVGRSSREVALLKEGGMIAHVTGPLGMPVNIEKFGTVVMGAGCYGVGAVYPIARAMKAAGNRVITVVEACSYYLIYWEDKLAEVSDEILFATKDGSRGTHGGVQDVFGQLLTSTDGGSDPPDVFVAIGCTFMMRSAVEVTRASRVPTYVALNPIMVDGTGMCGACRCTVEGETRFACIDGPIFNGHEVDWDELSSRRSAYANVEVEALSHGGPPEPLEAQAGGSAARGVCSEDRCDFANIRPTYGN